jgi:hypothetical protein
MEEKTQEESIDLTAVEDKLFLFNFPPQLHDAPQPSWRYCSGCDRHMRVHSRARALATVAYF